MTYIGQGPGLATRQEFVFTAMAAQTTFTGQDDNGYTLNYTVGLINVFVNGVLMLNVVDYVASDASSVVFTSGLTLNDIVTVEAYGAFSPSDTYTRAEIDADVLKTDGSNAMISDLNLSGNNFISVNQINGANISRKNYLINGNFDVWQRGTSGFTGDQYNADRWNARIVGGGGGAGSVSRGVFTVGQTVVPSEPTYYLIHDQTTGSTAQPYDEQRIEDVRTLAAQEATFTFWGRVTSGTLDVIPYWTQNFGLSGSANVNFSEPAFTLTTTWQKFTVTRAIPSISGKTVGSGSFLAISFLYPVSTVFQSQIARVSVVAGDATGEDDPFEQLNIGEILDLSQRYYQRSTSQTCVVVTSANPVYPSWLFHVEMRGTPSMSFTYAGGTGSTFTIGSEGFRQTGWHTVDSGFNYKADAEL